MYANTMSHFLIGTLKSRDYDSFTEEYQIGQIEDKLRPQGFYLG